MRTLFTKLLILAIVGLSLFSCKSAKKSKSTYSFGLPHHKFEQVKENNISSLEESVAQAKIVNNAEPEVKAVVKTEVTVKKQAVNHAFTKKEQKIISKLQKKFNQIEKLKKEKKESKSDLSKNLKIGIILASVGLLLILLGGLGLGILYVFGAIAFIIGGVLIFIELLDM